MAGIIGGLSFFRFHPHQITEHTMVNIYPSSWTLAVRTGDPLTVASEAIRDDIISIPDAEAFTSPYYFFEPEKASDAVGFCSCVYP
jgi:hypothetical protein